MATICDIWQEDLVPGACKIKQGFCTLKESGRVTPPAGDCGPSGSAAIRACSSASLCRDEGQGQGTTHRACTTCSVLDIVLC